MQELHILDQVFLGNPVARWLNAAGITIAVALALFVLKRLLLRRLTTLAARTTTELDDLATDLLSHTRFYFIAALALRAGVPVLALTTHVREALTDLTTIAFLLQLAVWGNGLITFWLRKWSRARSGDATAATSATISAIGVLARGVMWTLVTLLALKNIWNFDITALVTGLGIGGVAIALAVQNVLGELFAAISIVLDKPFDVGDVIAVDTLVGQVEHIGLKSTRVRATGGEQVIFSNADLLKSRVRNLKRMRERRVVFTVGVFYSTPPDVVAAIPGMIRTIVEAEPMLRFDRAHFARFKDSALEFEVVYFVTVTDYLAYMDAQQSINLALLRTFAEHDIRFAFPTQMVIQQGNDGRSGAPANAGHPTIGEPPPPAPGAS